MANDPFQYDRLVQNAFRGVMREALAIVVEHGLPGRHHFYVTFRTDHPEAALPDHLRAQFPREMTIVLQHQFWGLEVGEHGFTVTLSFNKVNERLSVPFAAVTRFVDPGANFGLQLEATAPDGTPLEPLPEAAGEGKEAPAQGVAEPGEAGGEAAQEKAGAGEKVVTLDRFRKS